MSELTRRQKIMNFYFDYPIMVDIIVVSLVMMTNNIFITLFQKLDIHFLWVLSTEHLYEYVSSLNNTLVALIGFMIAALTIMITVKASLKARGYLDASNAMEFIFTTDQYFKIVRVFTRTIIELVIILIVSYLVWLSANGENITATTFSKFLFCATLGTFLAIIRSVYIFFRILGLEQRSKGKYPTESNDAKQVRLLEEILEKLSENNS